MPPIEYELVNKYSSFGLRFATVVKILTLPNDPMQRSDVIHQEIALHAANAIMPAFNISSGDVFGVGSGRGAVSTCYYLWENYKATMQPRPSFITVVPLTGFLRATQWWNKASMMDATEAASFLGGAARNAIVHILGLPVAIADDELNAVGARDAVEFANLYRLPISYYRWRTEPNIRPRFCIVGVGVFRPGHAFWDNHLPELKPVQDDLTRLKDLIGSGPYIVGDLCNRLFVIDYLANQFSPQTVDDIKTLVEKINKHLLSVTPDNHLSQVGIIAIVAGGGRKKSTRYTMFLRESKVYNLLISGYLRMRIVPKDS